jgi:hypothetical protein
MPTPRCRASRPSGRASSLTTQSIPAPSTNRTSAAARRAERGADAGCRGPPSAPGMAGGKWEGPRMYEMQGPCPAVRCGLPVARPTCGYLAAAGTGYPPEVPVSRLFRRSGVAPGWNPSPAVRYFYCLAPSRHKGFPAAFSRFFCCPQGIHSVGPVVPRIRHFSTGASTVPCTARPRSQLPASSRHRLARPGGTTRGRAGPRAGRYGTRRSRGSRRAPARCA